jgi:Tfp pilus assembly protein PilO
MKIPPVKSATILTAIFIVILIALVAGAVIVQGKILDGSLAVRDQIDRLNKKRLTAESLRENLALAKDVKTQIADYDKLLLPPGNELELITDLENIAVKNKVSQRIIGSNLDNYANGKIEITVSIFGAYVDILRYISDLEKYKYIITIEQIDFSPSGASGDSASSRIQISLYANPK